MKLQDLTGAMADSNGWHPISERPERYGHYLVLSDMNWYHGGCFDINGLTWDKISRPEAPAGTTLSLHVAFFDGTSKWSWNDPYALAWHELPEIPQEFIDHNKNEFQTRLRQFRADHGGPYHTEAEIR